MIEIIPNWHPIFVHFTVALLSVAVILFIAVRFVKNEKLSRQWVTVAQWNLWLGSMITVLTVAMGVVAYNSVVHDTPSHEAMTEHRNWALVTTLLFLTLAVWSALRARAGQGINTVILLGLLVGGGLLFSTAWHGGEIVYRYGLGVMSLPKTDDHGHAGSEHDHAMAPAASHHDAMNEHNDQHEHGQAQKDDVENCELPEKPEEKADSAYAPDNNSQGHAHNKPGEHAPTENSSAESESQHDDGHGDHKH